MGDSPSDKFTASLFGDKTFWALSSFQILAMFRRALFYTYMSVYMRAFLGLPVTVTTLYATLPMLTNSAFQSLVWGRVSDKYNKRKSLIIIGEITAGILLTSVYFLHKAVPDRYSAGLIIIGGLTVTEAFWSMSNVGWSALISDLYPAGRRGRITALITSVSGIGRITGIFIGGLLYDGFGSEYPGWGFYEGALFIIPSIVMFISTVPMLFAPEGGISAIKTGNSGKDIEANDDATDPNFTVRSDGKTLLKIFWIFLVALFIINLGRNATSVIYPQYLTLKDGFNVTPVILSYLANTRAVATILIGPAASFIIKKYGKNTALLTGVISAVVSMVIPAFADELFPIYISLALHGCSEIITGAAAYEFAAELIPPSKRGRLFGIYNTTFFVSWGLGSTLVVGPLIDILMSSGYGEVYAYRWGFLASAFIIMLGALLLIIPLIAERKYKTASTQNLYG